MDIISFPEIDLNIFFDFFERATNLAAAIFSIIFGYLTYYHTKRKVPVYIESNDGSSELKPEKKPETRQFVYRFFLSVLVTLFTFSAISWAGYLDRAKFLFFEKNNEKILLAEKDIIEKKAEMYRLAFEESSKISNAYKDAITSLNDYIAHNNQNSENVGVAAACDSPIGIAPYDAVLDITTEAQIQAVRCILGATIDKISKGELNSYIKSLEALILLLNNRIEEINNEIDKKNKESEKND